MQYLTHSKRRFVADSKRVSELGDQVAHRDRRIAALRDEIDELRDLVTRQRENSEEFRSILDDWSKAFDMAETDGGRWRWGPFVEQHNKRGCAYSDLVRRWNKYYYLFRGGQPIGRPLLASETQIAEVLNLHKRGVSLRGIVDETSLGLPTVRTIIAKKQGTDRPTKRR